MKTRIIIFVLYLLFIGMCFIGLLQPALAASPTTQFVIGYGAATVILFGMAIYAASIFVSRRVIKARFARAANPTPLDPGARPTPFNKSLEPVDSLLTSAGFTRDSERQGLWDSAGDVIPGWLYVNADSTVRALIAYDFPAKAALVALTTYFEDEFQLSTRLSRDFPAVRRPGYESTSVHKLEEIVDRHNTAMQRVGASHGKPVAITTYEQEQAVAGKYYLRNLGYLYDDALRIALIWFVVIEIVALGLLVFGLIMMNQSGVASIYGVVPLFAGAFMMGVIVIRVFLSMRPLIRFR